MFNLFRKEKKETNQNPIKPKTILCIPGNWKDRSEIVTAIALNNMQEYIFAGMVLLNLKTSKSFELEICERDERMKESFQHAGMITGIPEEVLDEIDKHTFVIYVSVETGNPEDAKSIAHAGKAILKSGGIGIKVETAGKAFTKEVWTGLVDGFEESNLYQMFVIDCISDGDNKIYSCGMHNLGLKDCVVYNEELQEAVSLISIFSQYQLWEKPLIKMNQTFSVEADAPVYIITEEINQPYKDVELFENPYGMWKLQRKQRS